MVNNAGISPEVKGGSVPIWKIKDSTWDDGLQVNCTGTFFCVRAAAAQMVKQDPLDSGDRGWIINMASTVGLASMPNIGESCCNRIRTSPGLSWDPQCLADSYQCLN